MRFFVLACVLCASATADFCLGAAGSVVAKIEFPSPDNPRSYHGHATYKLTKKVHEQCFLLLPNRLEDLQSHNLKRLQALTQQHVSTVPTGGRLELSSLPEGFSSKRRRPDYIRIYSQVPFSEVRLEFKGRLPRLTGSDPDEWLFSDHYPLATNHCDDTARVAMAKETVMEISLDKRWQVAGPIAKEIEGKNSSRKTVQLKAFGRQLAFALSKDYVKRSMRHRDVGIELYVKNPELTQLVPTIRAGFDVMTELFGPYPFESLTLIETSEIQPQALPGLVTINLPRQQLPSRKSIKP